VDDQPPAVLGDLRPEVHLRFVGQREYDLVIGLVGASRCSWTRAAALRLVNSLPSGASKAVYRKPLASGSQRVEENFDQAHHVGRSTPDSTSSTRQVFQSLPASV
jgi:hypothetical protein